MQPVISQPAGSSATPRPEKAPGRLASRWTEGMVQAFFDQAPFYTGVLAPDGTLIEIGRAALEECGYQREEVLGKFFWDTAWWRKSSESRARLQAAFAAAKTGVKFQATLPYVTASETECWVDFSMSPVFGEDGALSLMIVTGTDIGERMKTASELAIVRQRLDSALVAAEIGTYQWDVVSDRLYGDHNLARLFGLTLDQQGYAPLGTFMLAIHPEDRERTAQRVKHSVTTGENFAEDYRIVHADGERWVNSRGRMLKDADGRVVTFFGLVMDITERKRVEREREAIAERLRRLTAIHETVLSGIADFAYVFDLEGRFLYANQPLQKLYGRTLDEVVGKTFIELGYPAWHAEMHLREIAHVVATKKPFQGEIPFRGESGISGIYDYIFTPVLGADGRVEAVAGTTRDVTERKRGEVRDRLLVDLDDATRPLTDPEAITLASAKLLVEYLGVNRCAYADVEEDENTFNLRGNYTRDVPSIVGRYRFDQFGDECLRQMRAGEPYVVSDAETDPRLEAVRDAYRATQIRSVICVPLKKSGRFVGAMAVHQNIVRSWLQSDVEAVQLVASRCWESIERARVIRVLAESEQRLRLAVATGRLGVWELDLGTQALTASEQCKSIHGRGAGAALSWTEMREAVHPLDRERFEAAVGRSIKDGGDYDIEFRTLWPDGTVHWILMRGQTGRDPDEPARRMIGVSLDITARKEAEGEHERLRDEAVRASRAKDDFLATLSHELRTPLNPVLLIASDAGQDPSLTVEVREAFETIRKNVELEARLIDDLLDLTSIVRGKLTIRKAPRDLHAILGDAIATVQPEFGEKAISLNVQLGVRKPEVSVDEVRIAQVFINLLKNAAKFTPRGGLVTLQTGVEETGFFMVRLSDTGIGLTTEELGRVFAAFEQGDHAREPGTHRFGGLGLGLAISQRLVELHGGTLVAASEGRGRGSTFTVRLPLGTTATPGSNPPTLVPAQAAGAQPVVPGGARVLLVEDHDVTRRTLTHLLEKRGYVIRGANSLAEARALAAEERFDFVVSDLGLPDGSGTDLMATLRDQFGLKGIALTGYGMDEDVARCRAAGFVTHLTKPVHVKALEVALREMGGEGGGTEGLKRRSLLAGDSGRGP